jgi:hypothetical protein
MALRNQWEPTRESVMLDYPAAVQLIEAGQVRIAMFETHLIHGTARLDDVAFAIIETQRGIEAIRKAFRLLSEAELDALHEAIQADMADLRAADVPLAENEARWLHGDR